MRKLAWHTLGGVLVTLGVVGELYIEFRALHAESDLRITSAVAMKDLELKAAAANERAGKAIRDAAEASERAAALSKEAAVLQDKLVMQDRRGSILSDPTRRHLFKSRIKGIPKQQFDIRYCRNPDSEIAFFSLSLMTSLLEAGWRLAVA